MLSIRERGLMLGGPFGSYFIFATFSFLVSSAKLSWKPVAVPFIAI
jgi:hypothetical protein